MVVCKTKTYIKNFSISNFLALCYFWSFWGNLMKNPGTWGKIGKNRYNRQYFHISSYLERILPVCGSQYRSKTGFPSVCNDNNIFRLLQGPRNMPSGPTILGQNRNRDPSRYPCCDMHTM